MNTLELNLVKLYDSLHKIEGSDKKPSELLLQQVRQSLAGTLQRSFPMDHKVINDTIHGEKKLINEVSDAVIDVESETIPEPLSISSKKNTVLITEDYYTNEDDYYIGINSISKPVVVYLQNQPEDGKILIVKSEMKPPMGNRKITIKSSADELIDGYSEKTIQVSHESVTLIYRGGGWHIIK